MKQARGCEEVARRLALLNMHAGDDKAEKYIMLNKRALEKIEQMAETKMDWGKDIKVRLGGGIRMQVGSVMMPPWMKTMAAKYHDRSKVEKKKKKKKKKAVGK